MAEPGLGADAATIVKDYPIWMASLAKKKADDPRFVERFELYLDGIELANAFTELNDPDEQADRLLAEQKYRRQLGRTEIPPDTDFIAALRAGMPPAAGIALGVDRLMMVCTNRKNITEVLPFSF
jgi:lysyl-tRNA synthetase class 2